MDIVCLTGIVLKFHYARLLLVLGEGNPVNLTESSTHCYLHVILWVRRVFLAHYLSDCIEIHWFSLIVYGYVWDFSVDEGLGKLLVRLLSHVK